MYNEYSGVDNTVHVMSEVANQIDKLETLITKLNTQVIPKKKRKIHLPSLTEQYTEYLINEKEIYKYVEIAMKQCDVRGLWGGRSRDERDNVWLWLEERVGVAVGGQH